MVVSKKEESVVKIDSGLLSQIENLIKKNPNKLKYVSKKHFVDLAVMEKLEKEK